MSTIYEKCQHRQEIQSRGDIVEALVGTLRRMRNPRRAFGKAYWAEYEKLRSGEGLCTMYLSDV